MARWFALLVGVAAQQGTYLEHHSFQKPMNTTMIIDAWSMGGATIPTANGMSVLPGTEDRAGNMWHKFPLTTEDWKQTYTFKVTGPQQGNLAHTGFTFWYVTEDVAKTLDFSKFNHAKDVNRNLESLDLDLFGASGTFGGFGVHFSNLRPPNRDSPARLGFIPNIGVVFNNGQRRLNPYTDCPPKDSKDIDFRNTASPVVLEIRYTKPNLKVTVDAGRGAEIIWEGTTGDLPAQGFMGISAATGEPIKQEQDKLEIYSLRTENFDSSRRGEEAVESSRWEQVPKGDFIHEHSIHKDMRVEGESIKKLTHMVYKLISETEPMRVQMEHAINTLNNRMNILEQTFTSLKDQITTRSGHDLDAEFENMKKELASLTKYASTEHEARQQKLDALHADIAYNDDSSTDHLDHSLNNLANQNAMLHEAIHAGSHWTFWLSLLAITFILAAGLGLYQKFRSWEKKHIL